MNTIISIHVAASPANTPLELGLRRLGLYIDSELNLLVELARAGNLQRAAHALDALSSLHLDPGSTDRDTRRLVETARSLLNKLLCDIRAMPVGDATCAPAGLADFDARVAWAGARLEDVIATLNWSLG